MKNIETAEDLLQELLEIKKEWGTLDVSITVYIDEDRCDISSLDIFSDGYKPSLHSIDINLFK